MTLHDFDRRRALGRLADETFDVVVVGGGVTGAGVALDAASRGLRTALVERDDIAVGTSSRSSKLVHGGLRYLQQREVALVYQALAERQLALRNAPHLVRPVPFLLPMFGRDGLVDARLARALGAALWQYDLTGGARIGRLHRRLDRADTLALAPALDTPRLVSGYLYHDARADDARYTLAIARTAACDHGAAVATRCAVTSVVTSGGAARGVRVAADGTSFDVRADAVVNATGVWAGGLSPVELRPAKGVHVTLPHGALPTDVAVVLPVRRDRRSVFVVPWGAEVYVGTTDTEHRGSLDDPVCTADDVDYLLGAVNDAVARPVAAADVVGSWAGLRPLVAGGGRSADLSRRHVVGRSAEGVVHVVGGKLTTWRRMAADAVDAVLPFLGKQRRCRTARLPIRGRDGWERIAARGLVDAPTAEHLAGRYGGEARTLMAMVDAAPNLAEALVPGLPYIGAEAVFAARHEQAATLDDVLARRTRARLLDRDGSARAAGRVAAVVADELGWDPARSAAEVAAYRASVDRERIALGLAPLAVAADDPATIATGTR